MIGSRFLNQPDASQVKNNIELIGQYLEKLDAHILKLKPAHKDKITIFDGLLTLIGSSGIGLSIWALTLILEENSLRDDKLESLTNRLNATSADIFFLQDTTETANNTSTIITSLAVEISTLLSFLSAFMLYYRIKNINENPAIAYHSLPFNQLTESFLEGKLLFEKVNLTFSDTISVGDLRDALIEKQCDLVRMHAKLNEHIIDVSPDSADVGTFPIEQKRENEGLEEMKETRSELLSNSTNPANNIGFFSQSKARKNSQEIKASSIELQAHTNTR